MPCSIAYSLRCRRTGARLSRTVFRGWAETDRRSALVAPFGGAVSDKYPRLVMLAGMILSSVSALSLTQLMTGGPDSLPGVMISLAAFGAGLGLYIAPDNNATMAAGAGSRIG